MSRAIAVLRPEPGNRVTAAAIEAAGRRTIRLPLFALRAIAWEPPDPAGFDALIATSANVFRHGGTGLFRLAGLPVHAVGEVTAEAARRAGFEVAGVGTGGAAELLARAEAAGVRRALHLAGRERTTVAGGIILQVRTVYASDPLPIPAEAAARLAGSVVLIQSARAGARLGEVIDAAEIARGGIVLVAISPAAAAAAGAGWEAIETPTDGSARGLIEAAIALAD